MSTHQRRLLLVVMVAIAAVLIAILGLDWFHARMRLTNGGSATLDVGLRTVRSCIDHRCESHRLDSESSFGLFAALTFWSCVVYVVVLAIQAACRVVLLPVLHTLTVAGIMVGVVGIGGLIVCGFVLAPASAVDDAGAVVIDRTWAMTLLFLGLITGFYALYLAVTDEVSEHDAPALVANPVYVARSRPVLPEAEAIALEPEPVRARDPFLPPSDDD